MSETVTRKRIGGGYKIIEIKQPVGGKGSIESSTSRHDDDEERFSASSYDESAEDEFEDRRERTGRRHHSREPLKLPRLANNGQASLVSSDTSHRPTDADDGYFETEDSDKQFSDSEHQDTSNLSARSHEKLTLPSIQSLNLKSPNLYRKKDNKRTEIHQTRHVPKEKGKRKHAAPVRYSPEPSEKPKRVSDYDDHPILRHVMESVIGRDLVIETPYGRRGVVYCDFTASGRSLSFIEDYITTHVMPTYANTHSTTGYNARQTGKFREEARNIIKRCVNASKDDVAIFTGSGATAGINKIAWALRLNVPRIAMDTAVFIGPYEHHSNILVWRELGTKVIRIRQDTDTGLIDLQHLTEELQFWREKRRQLLVCMSAASNVTGITTDVDAICRIAHAHNALAIFDYAAGAPYLHIDMNPKRGEYKDAVVISPHKFVGGPGTPGLIVAKKWLFRNSCPDRVGGGTVRFVTREQHAYVGNIEEKEEGGTPAIIESIRAGIVFRLKQEIGIDLIERREEELCNRAFAVWERNPALYVMGSHTAHRVPIFSFLTFHRETGRLLHHNYISTLLSDLYGIQARGGCACAGPYAEDLMGISEPLAKKYMWFLTDKQQSRDKPSCHHTTIEVLKPGFTRINLAYFLDDETVDFVIQAIDDIATHGWKLLPQYTFDVHTGSWHHKAFSKTSEATLDSLEQFSVDGTFTEHVGSDKTGLSYQEVLAKAHELYTASSERVKKERLKSASLELRDAIPQDKRKLKWFLTPYEANNILADKEQTYLEKKRYKLPFKLLPIPPRTQGIDSDVGYHSDAESPNRTGRRRQRRANDTVERRHRTVDGRSTVYEDRSPRRTRKAQENRNKENDVGDVYYADSEGDHSPRTAAREGYHTDPSHYVTVIRVNDKKAKK